MENSLYFKDIEENDFNIDFLNQLQDYIQERPSEQIYVLNAPLGGKYSYPYQNKCIVILSPKHKIIFIDVEGDVEQFNEFYGDFIEDLSSISDKYNYKEYIGRSREWKKNNTVQIQNNQFSNFQKIMDDNLLSLELQRISELLISLLIGSINDIDKVGTDVPQTLLEKVKKNIILFDGEQTRFIYKNYDTKIVTIQGLSGTGKTELLLHKLKEIYLKEDNAKIYFMCHSIALSNILRERVPSFFNFMKVEKQIEWNSKLWVSHAWGSKNFPNSGFYSYLCHFYKAPFFKFNKLNTDYEKIFSHLLNHINSLADDEFEYALDYILIDERQDFPDVLFALCDKIARKKVYIAGDIFQDIFENTKKTELKVDIVLNRCYRTDPRTLMFAHAIGLGLFDEVKLNWFSDEYWKSIGYKIERFDNREIHFFREPVRRFENLNIDGYDSVIFQNTTHGSEVIKIIKELQSEHKELRPDDIAIILMEENRKDIYNYIDGLTLKIGKEIGWAVNRAYENKNKIENTIYLSNTNNIKGLEFPFVICLSSGIQNTYRYRNILYTMLTRSFIQSYLLVTKNLGLENNLEGLKIINKERYIKTIEPTEDEKEKIQSEVLKFNENENISYSDFINEIFDELKIDKKIRSRISNAIVDTDIDLFDKEKTIKFIQANKEFY
ncbi:ATP-binding domain-containing protein [Flavobacterium sp. 17A]|uniref:ATP-binding domain-containing protein n=1 Tax=Flavobacterium potami TaxID=2872310 RepID=A0A9X1HDT2_9FLAO|nr:ATP-binding domain-containing protein [Flavobacterium potami]MBZ4037301.1 ATP-binding domain-containing protein [Flavobacterium potami]